MLRCIIPVASSWRTRSAAPVCHSPLPIGRAPRQQCLGHSAPHLSFLLVRLGGFAADYFRGNPSTLRAARLSGARCSGFGEADVHGRPISFPLNYTNMLPVGQQLWLKELECYVEFPPLQDPASYNLVQVLEQVKKMGERQPSK